MIIIKNYLACFFFTLYVFNAYTLDDSKPSVSDIDFEVSNAVRQHSNIKSLLLVVGHDEVVKKIAKIIRFDLEFSDQIDVEIKRTDKLLNQKMLKSVYERGISVCIYLEKVAQNNKNQEILKVTVKDPASDTELFSKNFDYTSHHIIKTAHRVSEQLLLELTGTHGPVLSTLAYCKQINPLHKVVCVADYACLAERVVVQARTINVAPSWHTKVPVLFYSQFTKVNSRLMSVDLTTNHHKVICSYDGLNMQPTFSPDGKKSVLCLSGNGNSELYLYDPAVCKKFNRRVFKQLTHNKGNNSSPCYLPNGDIVFCSDFQTGAPQLYMFESSTKKTSRLTNGRGYCAAPSYCTSNNSIVYTRYIHGVFQLFSLNLHDSKLNECQVTFNKGDKVEPTWSSCGKYIAFTYTKRDPSSSRISNQIAVLNTISGRIRTLTVGLEAKSFPVWTKQTLYYV